jgi:D-alanyl-D-alanine carboxypeptidase
MECSLSNTELWTEEHTDKYGERKFYNTNDLMLSNSKYYYPYVTGIKSGYTTPAKNCLVTGSNRYGFELVCVVLHAETTDSGESARNVDTINLLEYGYKNFNKEDIIKEYNYKQEQEKGFITGIVKNSDDDIDKTGTSGLIETNIATSVKKVIKIGSLLSFVGLVCLYIYKKKKEHKEFVINEYSLVDLYNFNLDSN